MILFLNYYESIHLRYQYTHKHSNLIKFILMFVLNIQNN